MSLSIHDNLLVSYEVQCEARKITLQTEHRAQDKPTEFTNVTFTGVEGYHFKDDAFGNIVFGLETVPVEQFLAEHHLEITESFRIAGSPGPWAAHLDKAPELLGQKSVQAFVLSSSIGLSGWVLARRALVGPAQ
jgi:hypothetical protein